MVHPHKVALMGRYLKVMGSNPIGPVPFLELDLAHLGFLRALACLVDLAEDE